MKRLTKDDVAAKLKDVIDKFDADGLRKNVDPSDRRYVKLAEYEQTGLMPEQIRHGHWIISSDGYYPYCSNCNAEPENGKMTAFCASCGAIMDEKGR